MRKVLTWAQVKGSREMHRERKAPTFIDVVARATTHKEQCLSSTWICKLDSHFPDCGNFSGLCVVDVRYCAGIVMLRNTAFYFFL
jgi:hypothetical protein